MPRLTRFFILLALSVVCIAAAGGVLLGQMARYNALLGRFPAGFVLAGVPAGGLDAPTAAARLRQVYAATPVELRVDGARLHIDPAAAGQRLDVDAAAQAAMQALQGQPYWDGLWGYLWNRPRLAPPAVPNALVCTVDEARLAEYLNQVVAPRYQQLPEPARPAAPADARFLPGSPGVTLDLHNAAVQVRAALCQPAPRAVSINSSAQEAPPAALDDLAILMQTIVQASGFPGVIEVYLQDLRGGQEINFAMSGGRSVEPGIAFTAASTIKIPVMVSAYQRLAPPLPADVQQKMAEMIDLSDNTSTDAVMQRVLDPNIAPVQVTEDAQKLGMENTFLAGFFYPGAPLLNRYTTPANTRTDISTDPDGYNQTSPADMGRLLAAIYRCASGADGPIRAAFDGAIAQEECQAMLALLTANRKGVLIENGLPDGARMGHKYGWVTDPLDNLMHNASDAAVIYSPGGDYILTIYAYQGDQLHWDPLQRLVAWLTTASYNFFNH
jgi:beta-lactamase class A